MNHNHIAIFIPDLRGGGAERSMVNLATGFTEIGLTVDLVLASASGPYLSLLPPSVKVVDLGVPRTVSALPKLVHYLRSTRPEALLSALDHANIVALLAKRVVGGNLRVAVSVRNTLSAEARDAGFFNSKILPKLVGILYPWADEIINVSGGVADDLANVTGIPRSRMRVIYNPVVSESMAAQARQAPDHPWLAPGEPPVVLAVGRLTPQKDYPTLLRAFAKARASVRSRLVILGEGDERVKLEELSKELGIDRDVSLAGFQENPFSFMARAGVFVLASRFEGLPGVLIQALACGCPVVSTDCPSGPREILDGGRWGSLVPVGDVDALAQAIESTLSRRASGEDLTPPAESWAPYEVVGAARRYAEAVFGRPIGGTAEKSAAASKAEKDPLAQRRGAGNSCTISEQG